MNVSSGWLNIYLRNKFKKQEAARGGGRSSWLGLGGGAGGDYGRVGGASEVCFGVDEKCGLRSYSVYSRLVQYGIPGDSAYAS